jgi:hypothetical protein
MIFPELPRHHYLWIQQSANNLHVHNDELDIQQNTVNDTVHTKTPLQGSALDEWMIARGYWQQPTDPAAALDKNQPINWLAKDAWEFYALCTIMTAWIVVWYGIHRGVW